MNTPENLLHLSRRRWVRQFMFGTVAALTGPAWTSRVFAEITSTGPGPGVLRIRPITYPALAAPGGSVQLKFIGYVKPLTLNRVEIDRFVTLDSVCTHAGCTVGRFILSSTQMRCPCHGSRYDIEGRVFRDAKGDSTEPAPDDLGRYLTSFDVSTGIISITIPDLALHISSISVHQQRPDETVRLKLVFPVTFDAVYEIYYQTDLTAPFNLIAYSKTPSGVANQTTVGPEAEGVFTAYVDAAGPRGFFSVGLKITEV